ncbi:MAG: beta-ribofuranosylaminobenzene 5'-phosphate synthase family protein [Gammaproteobacteria bacterium]
MKVQHAKVSVLAPARLHMGFIDLSGSLGRYFGSIGVALNEICTLVSITASDRFRVSGESAERASICSRLFFEVLNVPDTVHVNVENAIPEHIGLGSGTQMSLAVGVGLSRYYGLGLTVRDVAQLADRGKRSGIGIGVFEQGGLVVDGGRGEQTVTPPVLSQLPIPEAWRFILVFDARGQGFHGHQEIKAFEALPPFPEQEAARLCYLLMMQCLPAVVENDIVKFGDVISELQRSVGGYFAGAQGGVFTSPEVAEAMAWLAGQGAVAIGQTSWGPTGFCACPDEASAEGLVAGAKSRFADYRHLNFTMVSVSNTGARVSVA